MLVTQKTLSSEHSYINNLHSYIYQIASDKIRPPLTQALHPQHALPLQDSDAGQSEDCSFSDLSYRVT